MKKKCWLSMSSRDYSFKILLISYINFLYSNDKIILFLLISEELLSYSLLFLVSFGETISFLLEELFEKSSEDVYIYRYIEQYIDVSIFEVQYSYKMN